MATKKSESFEKKLTTLESLIEKLEQGDLPLEQALKQFEQGVQLARQCQEELKGAEQKVQILLQKSADAAAEPFSEDDEQDGD